jgi:2-Cys peroxiredoxin 5
MSIQVGEAIPSASLHENNPGNVVDPAVAFATGRTLLFAVPGAFTPGCSKTHLPGYIADFDAIRAKGVDRIACVAVNDAFVMAAWGEAHGTAGKIQMLADASGAFADALGLSVDAPRLGGKRSKRYAMLIDGGKVADLQVEPDGFGLSCSLSNAILERL